MTEAVKAEQDRTCVLVLDKAADHFVNALGPHFPELRFVPCRDYADLDAILKQDAPRLALTFKVGTGPFPRDMLINSGCLEWIHAGGAGIDHLRPWPDGLTVTNSSGIHGDIMAEYVLAAMIAFNQNGRIYELQQARRQWQKYECRSVAGQTLVIVGFGSIGNHVARLATAVGMSVIGVRSRPEPANPDTGAALRVVGSDQLNWALRQGDHVAICLPLTDATRSLIGEQALAEMKPGVHLINVARGGIVDEGALLPLLKSGQVGGATLDVFAAEPLPPDSPFWGLESVRVTPHSSSDIMGWEQRVIDLFRSNLERWRDGAPLQNVVESDRGY